MNGPQTSIFSEMSKNKNRIEMDMCLFRDDLATKNNYERHSQRQCGYLFFETSTSSFKLLNPMDMFTFTRCHVLYA